MNRRASPLVAPAIALAVGLAAAYLIHRLVPQPPGLPLWVPDAVLGWLSPTDANEVVLNEPAILWLLPAAVLPYLALVVRRSLVDVPPWQVGAQLLIRLGVLLALALALARPTLQAPIRGKTVVFAVDISASIDDGQLAAATALVEDARVLAAREAEQEIPREDRTRLHLVTYASQVAVRPLDPDQPLSTLERETGGGLASDHAAALRLAQALVDPQTEGRIVLVTDGTGDLAEREGLVTAARELSARGHGLHTRTFEPAARGDVIVAGVHLPDEMRVGQTFEVRVDLVSTAPLTITLALDKDGAPNPLAPHREVTLRGGSQQIRMPARVTEPGPVVFTARLSGDALGPAQNRSPDNDRAAAVGEVHGRPRVLLASGHDPSSALARALRADHLDVTAIGPGAVPGSADALRAYDLVVLSDVPARSVGGEAQRAIKRYVTELGGGLIMVGGEHAFGVGGWTHTAVEEVLPVRFEGERQREQPTLALVLVIDKSGSMSSEDKLDLVKEAARGTARALDPTDELGVIAFDSRPQVLVRLQPASNRIRIASDIRRLSAGGGTNALPALREAYLQLAGSKALVKHVILLSDGQSPENGITSLLNDMRNADITVSSVGVGAGAGKDFLARVAERGRGRYYFSHDGTDVPRIFSRETSEVTRNAIVERELYARVAKRAQVLRGIDFDTAPGLRGIVPIRPKAMSEVILRTHVGDPLLVRGRRGLGRTAAFASDAKPRWAARWMSWGGFAKLWSQLARDTMRQGASLLGGASISAFPAATAGAYRVVVDVETSQGFANDLDGEIEVLDPALAPDAPGHKRELTLHLSAPGRYEAQIEDIRAGQRLVTARLYDGSQEPRRLAAEATTQVSVPYPAELAPEQLVPRPDLLTRLSGTDHDHGPIGPVVELPGDPRGRTRDDALWPTVLWALLLPLFALDLLVRRLSLGDRRVKL